jgi:hypothetical protein
VRIARRIPCAAAKATHCCVSKSHYCFFVDTNLRNADSNCDFLIVPVSMNYQEGLMAKTATKSTKRGGGQKSASHSSLIRRPDL